MKPVLFACLLAACSAAAPDPVPSPVREPREVAGAPSEAEGSSSSEREAEAGASVDVGAEPGGVARVEPGEPSGVVQAGSPPSGERAGVDEPASLVAAIAALQELTPDPAPAHTTNDVHYLVSNERRHDLFRPELDERGGVQLGVGTDQNYVMAAWSRPELLVIVDFDQQVIDLHAVHGALLAAAPTVEDFRRLWSEEGTDEAHAAVRAAEPDRARRAELLVRYDETRPVVDKRLRTLSRRYAELGVHSYLDTPAQYRFVAELHARGRVVAIRGDFTVDGVLRELASVLEAHGLRIEVLYLSNIEQYLAYRKPFRANMLALPLAEDALVLRTLPGKPAGFHYFLQSGDDFLAWMRESRGSTVYRMVGKAKGDPPLTANERVVLTGRPDDPPAEG